MSLRSDKLEHLSKLCCLETGEFVKDSFSDLEVLYQKGKRQHRLAQKIRGCDKCSGMNIGRVSECCPGWGNLNADVMFVGQSLHEPGMYSQIPFVLGSGLMIDAALRLSGIARHDCFWTNVVLCHPERNRASTEEEKKNCWEYLVEIISIVQPRIVVALGKDAKQGVERYRSGYNNDETRKWLSYTHPASLLYASPEARPNWIVKMSLDLDKILTKL